MNTQKMLLSAIVIILFVFGGYWYYSNAPIQTPEEGLPFVSPTSSVTGGAFQLPTAVPHVVGPETPPPSVIVPPKPPATSSGIRGSVFIGPTCPIQRIPPDPNCADRPYAANLAVMDSKGNLVKAVWSDKNGMFEVMVPAGNYSIGPSPASSMLPRAGFQDVVVMPNAFTTITIQFDSGIR